MNMQKLRVQSLKARMALSTLAIFLLSMWALSFYASTMLREDMVRISGQQQYATVSVLAAHIDEALDDRFRGLLAGADKVAPALLQATTAPQTMQTLLAEDELLRYFFNAGVFLTRADGAAIAEVPAIGRAGLNYLDRDHIAAAVQQGKSSVGSPIIGKKVQAPSFAMTVPIREPQGRVIGALAGAIDLSKPNFLDKLMQSHYGVSGGYVLVSRQSQRIVSATDKSRIMQPLSNTTMAARYLAGHEGSNVYVNSQGVEVLASVKSIPLANWYLAAMLPTKEAFAPIQDMQQRLLWATLVVSMLACGITWWLLRRQLFPILGTVEKLAVMAHENAPLCVLPVPEHTEVAHLVTGVNRVLQTLESREVALLSAKAEAEAANQAKSRFLAAASHDLRQPLAALALYTGMLGRAVKPGQDTLVSSIQRCADNLSALLNDLLDVSKLDAGGVLPMRSDFPLEDLRASLQAIYGVHAQTRGLQLRFRCEHRTLLHTDRQIFSRLVGNLLDNAVQYTARGGVLLATRRHAGKLWLEVWDTGTGIAQDQIPAIFEEFRQLGDGARNRGSGLGLAIVSRSAALLGLQVRVASRPGRGSLFAVELPQGATPSAGASLPLPGARAVPPSLTIGLVEDNQAVLAALVLGMQSLGHSVVAGATGTALLEQLGPTAPDVLVTDYRLGAGETGLDVIAAARARFGCTLPVLVLTGETQSGLLPDLAAQGIAVCFKPITLTRLQACLQQAANGPEVLAHPG